MKAATSRQFPLFAQCKDDAECIETAAIQPALPAEEGSTNFQKKLFLYSFAKETVSIGRAASALLCRASAIGWDSFVYLTPFRLHECLGLHYRGRLELD